VRSYVPVLESWIRWRTGEIRVGESLDPGEAGADFPAYLSFELRHAAGEAPELLLEAVREAESRSSETRPLLRSLEAVLLLDLGQAQAAAISARNALEEARNEAGSNVYVRAHLAVIEERGRAPGG